MASHALLDGPSPASSSSRSHHRAPSSSFRSPLLSHRDSSASSASLPISRPRVCCASPRCCGTLSGLASVAVVVALAAYIVQNRYYDPLNPKPPPKPIHAPCPYNATAPFVADSTPPVVNTTLFADFITACWQQEEDVDKYEVQSNDWWNLNTTFRTIGTFSNQTYINVTNLLPAVLYPLRVRAVLSNGTASPWSTPTNVTTLQRGYCGNPSDIAAYRATKTTMKGDIQGCLIGCAVQGQDCAVECISKKVGLSRDCAQCWGEEGMCTLKHCAMPCLKPSSQSCKQCSEDRCFPACVVCSGVPQWAFPP